MGVKDLNKLIQTCTKEPTDKIYSKIVIDGSNLIFNKLSASVSKLKKEYPINDWQSVNLNLLSQTKYIVLGAIDEITYLLRRLIRKYNPSKIYIVMDPVQSTPKYVISSKLKNVVGDNTLENAQFIEEILTPEEIENNSTLTFMVKEEEQKQRKKSSSKVDVINNEYNNIDDLDLDAKSIDIIKDIFNQSYHYNIIGNMLALSRIVLNEIGIRFQDKVFIINSNNEADLVIKNVVHIFDETDSYDGDGNENHSSLIMSADTDYFILFADDENVDVCGLYINSDIYNPFNCWNELLEDSYSFDAVIRLAPLFGNDYTIHESIMSTKTKDIISQIQGLFDANSFDMIKENKRTKLYKIVKDYEPDNDFGIETIDKLIHDFDINYFIKYYKSIIIYKNWDIYNDFDIYILNDVNVIGEIRNHCKRLQILYKKIYKWDSDKLFNDWNGLVKNVKFVSFDNIDGNIDGNLDSDSFDETNDKTDEGDEFIDED